MIFLNVNNFSTTITQPLMPSSGTINVQSSAGLPSSIPAGTVIPLTLNDALTQLNHEIVYITAISGTTLTVSRGEENTAAQDWKVGDFAFSAMTAGSVIPTGEVLPSLAGTSGSLGGSALSAGGATTGTVNVPGATTSMAVVVTPSAYPGNGVDWAGYVSSSGVVTVVITAIIAVTPTATTYNVRVIQ